MKLAYTPTPQPQTLEHALKVWRMHEAKRLSIAPFDLIRDPAIREIATHKPATIAELSNIPGISGTWAQQHGAAVCAVIAQHA